jgi:hypothetical protein
MPEQLTKHPDVTIKVLTSGGARCGEGARQEILTACPAAQFCKLPGGEVCIYGVNQAQYMTQITKPEWSSMLKSLGVASNPQDEAPVQAVAGAGIVGLVIGAGIMLVALRRRRHTG